MKKYHYLIFTLLFLAAGCSRHAQVPSSGTGSQVTPTSTSSTTQDIVGWKSYNNTVYGFEFKYPSTWEVQNSSETGINVVDPQHRDTELVSVSVTGADPENSLRAQNQITSSTTIQIQGETAKKFSGESAVSGRQAVFVAIPHNGMYYTIVAPSDTASQFISSFSFIPAVSQAGWVYENRYVKVMIPTGWAAKEASQVIDYNNCATKQNCSPSIKTGPNPAAVNITKGKYILYVNTRASQASGVEGGRFEEFAGGAPSVDALIVDHPGGPCGTPTTATVTVNGQTMNRVDYYISSDEQNGTCRKIASKKPVWYFSVVGGGINYYNIPHLTGPDGWVVTMAYDSKDPKSFPAQNDPSLETALSEMSGILKTLTIKAPTPYIPDVSQSMSDLKNTYWSEGFYEGLNSPIVNCTESLVIKKDKVHATFYMETSSSDGKAAYSPSELSNRIEALQNILSSHGWSKCNSAVPNGISMTDVYKKGNELVNLNKPINPSAFPGVDLYFFQLE